MAYTYNSYLQDALASLPKTTQKATTPTKATTTLPTYIPAPIRDTLAKVVTSQINKATTTASAASPSVVTAPKATTTKTASKATVAATPASTISWAMPEDEYYGGGGGGSSASSGYNAAQQAYKEAMDAAYNQTKAQLQSQAAGLKDQYDTTRGQAYTTSRLNAIGNNEALASMGLAGNMYEGPTSGYSETSRIAENTAMRGSINEANLAERQARDTIAQEIVKAGYTRDQSVAQYTADLLVQQAQDQLQRDLQAQQMELQYAQLAAQLAKTATKTSGGSSSGSGSGGGTKTPVTYVKKTPTATSGITSVGTTVSGQRYVTTKGH